MLATIPAALAGDPTPDLLPAGIHVRDFTYEHFGEAEFYTKTDKPVVYKGQHWHANLTMDGFPKDADSKTIWAAIKPQMLAAGWTVLLDEDSNPYYAELHNQKNGNDVRIAFSIYYYGDVRFNLIEAGSAPRPLTLTPPAAKPETVTDGGDFPYLTPMAGSEHRGGGRDNEPMMVTLAGSDQPEVVGTSSITKSYGAPHAFSALEFFTAYTNALTASGWAIVQKSQGADQADVAITAHYGKNGRDIWAYLHGTGDEYSIQVSDAGADKLAQELAQQCHVALYGVLFDFNKSTLKPESDAVLERVADLFARTPALKVEVQGHTDNVGTDSYNQTLSEARAKSVVDWLVAHGVAADRLTAKGYGETRPVADNSTDEGRAKNRRVEIADPACKAK